MYAEDRPPLVLVVQPKCHLFTCATKHIYISLRSSVELNNSLYMIPILNKNVIMQSESTTAKSTRKKKQKHKIKNNMFTNRYTTKRNFVCNGVCKQQLLTKLLQYTSVH